MSRLRELLSGGPVLQVALDYTRLEDALRLASMISMFKSEPLVIEAGTPLVKSEGVRAVSLLSSILSPTPIVADLKIADTGALEARIAIKAGASAVTVLGCAGYETVVEAVAEAHRLGGLVVADMLGLNDPLERVRELEKAGVDIVEIHVGIDVQRRLGVTVDAMARVVEKVKALYSGFVAVAGGLNERSVPLMVRSGADIIVVGGAITRSKDPLSSVQRILAAIRRESGGR